MIAGVILAVWLVAVQDRQSDPSADLAAARSLYATAAYEDALDRLNRINSTDALRDQVDTYKALCLLALGRTGDSEKMLEQILARNPQYVPNEGEVSPRLMVVFKSVRSRQVPATARSMYAAARANFDDKKYEMAAAQLRELITLLNADDNDPMMADLRLLAEDFLRLAETGGAPPIDTRTQLLSISRVAVTRGPIYSILDRNVVAPVEVSRPLPILEAPRGTPLGLYQGLVEVVIDEAGRVESATIRRSISAPFDAELLASTEKWRFQPATRNGQPVKYRRSYEVIGHSR
jgi:TonB family protein